MGLHYLWLLSVWPVGQGCTKILALVAGMGSPVVRYDQGKAQFQDRAGPLRTSDRQPKKLAWDEILHPGTRQGPALTVGAWRDALLHKPVLRLYATTIEQRSESRLSLAPG